MQHISSIRVFDYPRSALFNSEAACAIAALRPEDFRQCSHFVAGRFENLYLDPSRIPGLKAMLDYSVACAAISLQCPPHALRYGFWLNRMAPGQKTMRHAHDENDELLSGVYYIQVPENSGDLLFDDDPFEIRIRPSAGMGLLFDPALMHWVEEHRGCGERLSIAFNIGPARN